MRDVFAIAKQRVMSESGCTARDVFTGTNEFGPVLPMPESVSESGCTTRDVFTGTNEFGPVLSRPGRNLTSALHQTHFFCLLVSSYELS